MLNLFIKPQEEAFKKITAILASLVAVIPIIMRLFEGAKIAGKNDE